MNRQDRFSEKFTYFSLQAPSDNDLPNPCFKINNSTGDAFAYMKEAMDTYVKAIPESGVSNLLNEMGKWSRWTEATAWYFLSQSDLDIILKECTPEDTTIDYVLRLDDSSEILIECKHKSAFQPESDLIWAKNMNRLDRHFSADKRPDNYRVIGTLKTNKVLTSKNLNHLETIIRKSSLELSDTCVSIDVDTTVFSGQILKEAYSTGYPWFSCTAVQYEAMPPSMSDWLATIKKQHWRDGGRTVLPFIHIDVGITMYGDLILDLHQQVLKQDTFDLVLAFQGPLIGEIESSGMTVLTKESCYRNVMANQLKEFIG